jgi:fumarate hydratase class II
VILRSSTSLRRRADDWSQVVQARRTHLMDTVPNHVGPGGRRRGHQAEYGAAQLRDCYRGCPSCCLSAAPRSAPASEHPGRDRRKRGRRAASATGLGVLTDAADHMDAQGAQNGLISAFGARRTVAVSL